MAGRETYDVSATERKILEARAARRTKLRHEYLKQINNPYRMATGEGGSVFDMGLQRFHSMKATSFQYWRPSPTNAMWYFGAVIFPTALVTYLFTEHKKREELTYRTGQVSYRDREFKFR